MQQRLDRLRQSAFRRRFKLSVADVAYIRRIGDDALARHARDFVAKRLAPAHPENDGKQTPMRGHPVFIAQHACACCCRRCLQKWHGIPQGHPLTFCEQELVVELLLYWIQMQLRSQEKPSPCQGVLDI